MKKNSYRPKTIAILHIYELENSSYTDRAAVGNTGVSDTAGRCAGMHDRSISDIDSNMSAVTYNVTRLCR